MSPLACPHTPPHNQTISSLRPRTLATNSLHVIQPLEQLLADGRCSVNACYREKWSQLVNFLYYVQTFSSSSSFFPPLSFFTTVFLKDFLTTGYISETNLGSFSTLFNQFFKGTAGNEEKLKEREREKKKRGSGQLQIVNSFLYIKNFKDGTQFYRHNFTFHICDIGVSFQDRRKIDMSLHRIIWRVLWEFLPVGKCPSASYLLFVPPGPSSVLPHYVLRIVPCPPVEFPQWGAPEENGGKREGEGRYWVSWLPPWKVTSDGCSHRLKVTALVRAASSIWPTPCGLWLQLILLMPSRIRVVMSQ